MLLFVLGGLLFFEGRRITFSLECLSAEKELEKNFQDNKPSFYELMRLVKRSPSIQFDMFSGDTIYLSFHDTAMQYKNLFRDSVYTIGPQTKTKFSINSDGCLEVMETDTWKVCNQPWEVRFYGHYKDQRIDHLLNYYGWTRYGFEQLVRNIQAINCNGFRKEENDFSLRYKNISYFNDGILHCFGHHDGSFEYLYTTQPESFPWQNNLKKLEENYYTINSWNF